MLRRKAMRRRGVTNRVSPEKAEATFAADGYQCVAPRLGGTIMDCWGSLGIEHVKVEQRMGRRGELLVTLCEGHREPGMKAGYVWCTDAENRRAMRDHALNRPVNPHEGHVDPCGLDCIARVPVQ